MCGGCLMQIREEERRLGWMIKRAREDVRPGIHVVKVGVKLSGEVALAGVGVVQSMLGSKISHVVSMDTRIGFVFVVFGICVFLLYFV